MGAGLSPARAHRQAELGCSAAVRHRSEKVDQPPATAQQLALNNICPSPHPVQPSAIDLEEPVCLSVCLLPPPSQWLLACVRSLPPTCSRRPAPPAAVSTPPSARLLSPAARNGPRGLSSSRLPFVRLSAISPQDLHPRSPSDSASCAGPGASPSCPPLAVLPMWDMVSMSLATLRISHHLTQARRRWSSLVRELDCIYLKRCQTDCLQVPVGALSPF